MKNKRKPSLTPVKINKKFSRHKVERTTVPSCSPVKKQKLNTNPEPTNVAIATEAEEMSSKSLQSLLAPIAAAKAVVTQNFVREETESTADCVLVHTIDQEGSDQEEEEEAVCPDVADESHGTENVKELTIKETKQTSGDDVADGLPGTTASSEAAPAAHLKTFKDLGLCEELCIACEALGWDQPTDIQMESLPHSLNGRDIIGLAETGSGKTAAFALPVVQRLLDHPSHRGVFALILAPTRELSVQISEQFEAIGAGICLKVCTILGGMDMVAQAMELAKKPHVVVATPGRIVDHLENTKGFNLGAIRFLVMDEADRLLSMDFEEAIDKILDVIPRDRNTFLFSATMTDRVSKLQRASLVRPIKVHINSKYDTSKKLIQHMKLIAPQFKWTYLVGVLSYLKSYSFIIFSNTCADACKLATCLRHLGFSAVCLHGKMSQPQRLGALHSFKSAQKKILVATEVGSRGLDIPHIDVVINFDVPSSSKDYIHRVGRTARAGRSGRALTLVTPYDVQAFQQIEQATKKKMDPYEDVGEEQWRALHEKVEEARLLTEREAKEEQPLKRVGYSSKNKRSSKLLKRR